MVNGSRVDVTFGPETPAQVRERKQKEAFQDAAAKFTAALVLMPVQAWLLMLVLGALHASYAPVAAVGYGTAVLYVIGADLGAALARKFFRK